jgi:opacity protein-like surface antigen
VNNLFGWTVGGGVECAFAEVWSARLEYGYYGREGALQTSAEATL